MAKVKITGHASGSGVLTVTAPNTSTDRTITLPDATGTLLNSDGDGSNLTGISSVGGATGVDFNDNVKVRFGTGNDAEIYHDGTHTYYKNSHTSGSTRFNQKYFEVNNTAGTESMLSAYEDGAVTLRHNSATKLETTATGIAVTGGVAIGGTGTANTLDDYEEGTWTPVYTVTGGGSHSSVSAGNAGTYTKVGRIVTISIYSYIVQTSGTITGYNVSLPFAAGNYPSSGMGIEFGHSGHGQKLQVNHNASTMNITKYDGTSPMGSAYFHIGITYHAA